MSHFKFKCIYHIRYLTVKILTIVLYTDFSQLFVLIQHLKNDGPRIKTLGVVNPDIQLYISDAVVGLFFFFGTLVFFSESQCLIFKIKLTENVMWSIYNNLGPYWATSPDCPRHRKRKIPFGEQAC